MYPTLHISNIDVNKIIQVCKAAMTLKSNIATKPLIVTLNTFAHEVPNQYLESFGKLQGESGQLILSKGNDKDLMKVMSSLSQANLTTSLIISKENRGEMSAPRWAYWLMKKSRSHLQFWIKKFRPKDLEFVPKIVIENKNKLEAFTSKFNPTKVIRGLDIKI